MRTTIITHSLRRHRLLRRRRSLAFLLSVCMHSGHMMWPVTRNRQRCVPNVETVARQNENENVCTLYGFVCVCVNAVKLKGRRRGERHDDVKYDEMAN